MKAVYWVENLVVSKAVYLVVQKVEMTVDWMAA